MFVDVSHCEALPRSLPKVNAGLNLTLQYFTMYPSFFVSIIVNQFINMEILCCVMPIFEAAWMTVMATVTGGHPSRRATVTGGHPSLLSPQCRL